MTEFKGRQAAEDDEIGPCPDGAFRRGGEHGADATTVREEHQADEDRREQRREQRPDQVARPAAPTHERADRPGEHPADGRPNEEVGELVAVEDEPGIVQRPGQGQAHQQDQRERQPAFCRSERWAPTRLHVVNGGLDRVQLARTSPRGRPGVMA